MNDNRRDFLVKGTTVLSLAALGFISISNNAIGKVRAWQQSWFEKGKSLDETFDALGIIKPTVDGRVIIHAPDTAENGAYVGISVETVIPNVSGVAFLVEKNPNALAGYFEIKNTDNLKFATKIKMAETSDLVALVKADNAYYVNSRHIKVILGGCGS